MESLLRVNELSERLKVSEATIYRMMKKGMPVVKISNNTRFDYKDVIDWLKKGEENE